MTRSFFQFEESAWWLLLILLISVALSYFLYTKKNVPWNTTQNWTLFGLRSAAIFLILLLFVEPSIKKVVNTLEKPIMALAIDDSESITARNADSLEIRNRINALTETLNNQGIEVKKFTLSESETITFSEKTTRLSKLLSNIDDENEENLVGSILLTDGIFNRGSSPLYRNYLQPIFTVGMGDTIPPKDISISRTLYNKVTFIGNETPLRLEISQQGYGGLSTSVKLTEGGSLIEEKEITLNKDIQEIEFLIASEEEGLRHLVLTTPTEADESTSENNRADIFLEVIDGRQKILIVAGAPHPDIKAIRRSLEATDSYTTEVYIPSIQEEPPKEVYDVIVYHGAFNQEVGFTPKEQPGLWYILNSRSAINPMNQSLTFLNIDRKSGQPDRVTGSFNQNFSKFKIDNTEIFEEYPPIEVPYGDYAVSGASEVLMYQKFGSVVTTKPLMAVHDDGTQKSAILMGENIWRWKLQEAAINDNSQEFDNFITKTIQFLSVKNDKKQFRFDARKSTFSNSQPIVFDTEVYNEIYERIYGNSIEVTLTDETDNTNSYEFVDSELNNTFRAPSLSPGVYRFSATVQVGEASFTEQGEFLIENVNTEFLNLTADHRLLRNLAYKTGGEFIHFDQMESLPDIIASQNFKPILRSDETYFELIKSWWYYLIIFLLFSTEWILRRYWGGY